MIIKRDIIIALGVSICIHGGLGWGDWIITKLFGSGKTKIVQQSDTTKIDFYVPPELPEVPPDLTEATDEPAVDLAAIAPPSIMDVPSSVTVESYVQQMAPPPPPSLGRPDGSTMTIPVGNLSGSGVRSNLGTIFNISDLDKAPEPRGYRVQPEYPYELKRQGIEGEAVLEFIVNDKGDVLDVNVISSTHREFESPAVQGVQKWKFSPGRKGGKAVNTRMRIPVAFTLNDSA